MKRFKKIIKISIITISIVLIVGVIAFLRLNHTAKDEMFDHLENDYVETSDYFMIDVDEYIATLVYYPGGLVSAEAYLLQADLLAREGIRVIIPKMPLNLAILDRYVFTEIHQDDGKPWILAGHSLGGASAAYVAQEHSSLLKGLIFLAAYPPSSVDLSTSDIPVLSIVASEDGVIDWERFEVTKSLLPPDTQYVEIEGGNHAQFGFYGPQRGDFEATITTIKQHEQQTALMIDFIHSIID